MVTEKPHSPAADLQPFSPDPSSPPSKRDLISWWKQFTRTTKKEDIKGKPQGIFGVPLNVSIKYANVAISLTGDNTEDSIYGYIPIVVAKCGVFLKEKATDVEGIFRLNGSAKRIKDLQEIFDSPGRYGKGLDWTGYTVHDAANVLRRYLNLLPEPIVPLDFYERFREPLRAYQKIIAEDENSQRNSDQFDYPKAVAAYQQLINELPPLNKQLLLYILDLLAVFASKSEQNRMTSANLSAIFQPGILSHPDHYMSPNQYKLSQDVLIFLIENQDHFLFWISGVVADVQAMREIEPGATSLSAAYSNVRRSVSSASNGRDNARRYDNLRRNVSISSRNPRGSNAPIGPGASQPLSGVGVHRSSTVPSKTPPATLSRFAKGSETSGNPPARHARSASRTHMGNIRDSTGQSATTFSGANAYMHSVTHGLASERSIDRSDKTSLRGLGTPASPPPVALSVATPAKERRISTLFSKSPPPGMEREIRQPTRLQKRRITGNISESAQSSSISLQAATTDSSSSALQGQEGSYETGGATPKALITSNPVDERSYAREIGLGENNRADTRSNASRTPSRNSSFTDRSGDQTDEASRSEGRESRWSWRFARHSKRSSEQLGSGLASPPLSATEEHSASSFGSGYYSGKSSPSDFQLFTADPSAQPLSLDAEVAGDLERRSLFGKFKARMVQVREGVKEKEMSKSPMNSEAASRTLSPSGSSASRLEASKDDLPYTGPPIASSGPPPVIPEEPSTRHDPGRESEGLPVAAAARAVSTLTEAMRAKVIPVETARPEASPDEATQAQATPTEITASAADVTSITATEQELDCQRVCEYPA